VKIFLYINKVGFIGLLETKIKEVKVEKIATNLLNGWSWAHNFYLTKGRILIAWKPSIYLVTILHFAE